MSSRRQMFLPWACTYLSSLEGERTVWSRNRSKSFWSPVVLCQWTKLKWKENFRVSQTTFRRLCEDLRPYIQKNDINCRDAIAVEHRVASHCSLAFEWLWLDIWIYGRKAKDVATSAVARNHIKHGTVYATVTGLYLHHISSQDVASGGIVVYYGLDGAK